MPTTRIQEKLSNLVASQLPEHIRSDYPTFVKFLEAYYEFLEQDQYAQELLQNSLSYRDVDRTIEGFITNFLKQYLPFIPRSALADKKLLIKKIRDLYSSKGSSKSYELLFRLLYNIEPEIYLPYDLVLKASDGKWIQRSTVFIKVFYGNPEDLVGKEADLVNTNKRSKLKIGERSLVETKIGSNYFISPEIFEYEFDNSTNVDIREGDTVITSTAKGTIISVPTKIEILEPGLGFKIGDIVTIKIADGLNLKFKVIKVDDEGGILNLQILRYGINYPTTFYYTVSVGSVDSAEIAPTIPVSIISTAGAYSITINDSTTFLDYGFVNKPDYIVIDTNPNNNYWDSTYAGLIQSTFAYNEAVGDTQDLARQALLNISSGVKCFYPGYYKTTEGFLSDEFKLEDRDYYQPYSYVIRSVKQLNEYRNAVLDLVHPAGTKLHGDYLLADTFDLTVSILSKFGFSVNDFIDFVVMEQSSFVIDYSKNVDSLTSLIEDISLEIGAFYTESLLPVSEFTFSFEPNYNEILPAVDTQSYDYQMTIVSNDYALDFFESFLDFSSGYTNTVPHDAVGTSENFSLVINP